VSRVACKAYRGYNRVTQLLDMAQSRQANEGWHGPLNPTPVDHVTATYDTVHWLAKSIPKSNGKVGILGTAYDGFLPLMALANPHPALKLSVPMNPMVDGWKGDEWFHNGVYREQGMPYIYQQEATHASDVEWWSSYMTTMRCSCRRDRQAN
jgi:predicted acyl esterase